MVLKMATPAKARPMKERFEAAIKVIRSLPTEGPYQSSNTAKLRFYALYKQVTQGACNIPKPGFWDAVGRAKWEAWTVCGEMSTEVAMQMYIEELQRVVETMPQTTEVEQFLLAISPFYEEEEIDDETKAEPVTAETTTEEAPNEEMTSTEVPTEPTDENVPPKPTNQMSDDSEDGEGSGSETDESVDFKDSFQELSSDPPGSSSQSYTTSSPSTLQDPPPLSVSHGNRPPRTVTFAEPSSRQNVPGGGRSGLGSIDTVTAEVARIQTNIQSMLQQLNTLAMAVNGLTRTLGSSSTERGTAAGHDPHLMVPRLVTRRGPLLTLLLKTGPLLAVWPLVVSIVMAIISRRFRSGTTGLPSWAWLVVTALQALFTLLIVRRLQL
ncbi:acyl-CoA-binding domain-containing protein 5-like [Halichondria panicea]|uniref:acyl-CoA-binding domain-containing protein 5-like n=1 Tax=Halichondria panicea TaxID=6063 RepID=UPI00312B5A87